MRSQLAVLGILLGIVPVSAAQAQAEHRKLEGYAEWRKGDALVVDGQRVHVNASSTFKGKGEARSFDTIPLGYEVKVEADRASDGSWLARKVEARPNGLAMFETDLQKDFDEIESEFRRDGHVFEEDAEGHREDYGRLIVAGPDVRRVERIVSRLLPSYFDGSDLHVFVVENEEWNAMAAPNGAIFVFTGLLENTSDDELAFILGHELAHVTHEHGRREMKKSLLPSLFMMVAIGAAEEIHSEVGRFAVDAAALAMGMALQNGYSRKYEDQADRVGLRYAYEAGYDVRATPHLWERFAAKYHDLPKAVQFLLGDHSRSIDRAHILAAELDANYAPAVQTAQAR